MISRSIGVMRLLARDTRVPRPLRFIAAIGLLPIPGPLDEIVLVLVAPVFLIFYRDPMREAWRRAGIERASATGTGAVAPRQAARRPRQRPGSR